MAMHKLPGKAEALGLKVTAQFPSTIHFRLRTSQRWIERPLGSCDSLVELLFEPRRNSSQASHNVLGPFYVFQSPLNRPVGCWTGRDGSKIAGFVGQFYQFGLAALLWRGFDLFALSFFLRKRLVVSHFHDDIGNLFSEFPGDHLDRHFLILNAVVQQMSTGWRHSK